MAPTTLLWCFLVLTCAERPEQEPLSDLQSFIQVPSFKEHDAHIKRRAAFEFLWRRYFSHWRNMTGSSKLSMPGLKPNEVTMQFEFEVVPGVYLLKLTPELLLLRGRIDSPDLHPKDAIFQSGSPLWSVEVDGRSTVHSNLMGAMPELNSVVMHPQEVLKGSLASDLESYLKKLHVSTVYRKFQFTLGLPLERTRDLMKHTPLLQLRVNRTAQFCQKPKSCSQRYEGLLLLCQMVMDQAVRAPECGFPKRFQTPWLLRTHIGDLAKTVHEDEREHLAEDVLKIWGKDKQLYPKGIMDYLNFLEMAEMSGVVKKRFGPSGHATVEMPTDLDGLKKVAARMIKAPLARWRLRARPCTMNAPGNKNWTAPTAREWLEGVQQGLDLMSDHDSPLSQASLSKTVWKSMGSWRWSKDEPRIFLECRDAARCVGAEPLSWARLSFGQMFQAIGLMAHELEQISLEQDH